MRYWWVNQNQTYEFEVNIGYLWSPKKNTNGARNHYYDAMKEARPGDTVFSFCDTQIKAVGIVSGPAISSARPKEFSDVTAPWSNDGWYLPVTFTILAKPIRPKDHIDLIRPALPQKYSPLQQNGNGIQSVYLTEVPMSMATVLIALLAGQTERAQNAFQVVSEKQVDEDQEERRIQGRTDIGPTEKDQLVRARRGQGIFRSEVGLREKGCRVTATKVGEHLRASHIKPWKNSSDKERLDGENGLLLAPHVDHLFDRGYISFEQDGTVLVSPLLDQSTISAWGLNLGKNVGPFREQQRPYLDFHRNSRFLRTPGAGTSLALTS